MEELKSLDSLTAVDERHVLLGQLTGNFLNIADLHAEVSAILLHAGVPDELRSQFNVARNLALYQYFYYGLAPEVQLKTYTIIEYALRLRADDRKTGFKELLRLAVGERWISDAGFRHLPAAEPGDPYCANLVKVLPSLRNSAAHGSNQLSPHCIGHLEKCADFVNQLFPKPAFVQP